MPVEESRLDVPSRWGRPATYACRRHTQGSHRLVLLLPGYDYTLQAPALWYAARAAAEAGCDVVGVEYGFQANRGTSMRREEIPEAVAEVAGAVERLLAERRYADVVVIAKSIGTRVATELIGSGRIPAPASVVLLTPLRATLPFMRQTPRLAVVVGDRDSLFGPEDIAQVRALPNVELHVMAGAGHVLDVDGDVGRSLEVLRDTVAVCRAACASPQVGGA